VLGSWLENQASAGGGNIPRIPKRSAADEDRDESDTQRELGQASSAHDSSFRAPSPAPSQLWAGMGGFRVYHPVYISQLRTKVKRANENLVWIGRWVHSREPSAGDEHHSWAYNAMLSALGSRISIEPVCLKPSGVAVGALVAARDVRSRLQAPDDLPAPKAPARLSYCDVVPSGA
jgi:hypothetical protein